MKQYKHYDAVVIGSGQAGKPIAFEYASKKLKVALIENNKLGGSCINYGCTPSKALIASSELFSDMRHSEELGIKADDIRIDFRKIIQRKNKIVESFRSAIEKSVAEEKYIDLYKGTASFEDEKNIRIDIIGDEPVTISGDKIFINTGTSPNIIDIKGLSEIKYHDSSSIMDLEELPEHLIIIGTGYIALEMGQMFAALGSKVTMIGRGNKIIDKEDDDICEEIQKILENDGVDFELKRLPISVRSVKEKIVLKLERSGSEEPNEDEGSEQEISGSHLMIAAGRVPNTSSLRLNNTSIKTDDRGYIKTDKYLRTGAENIFALGDVKGGPEFTHVSYDDYRVAMDYIFGSKKRNTEDRILSYTLFTQPQLGRIGLNEKQAKEMDIDYELVKINMRNQARAIEESKTNGFMKALIDKKSKKILGASILGYQGGEIMSMIQIAMMGDLKCTDLKNGMFSHPSLSESLNNLFRDC